MTRFAESYAVWLADYYLLATVLLAVSLTGITLLRQPAQRLMVTKSAFTALVLLAILCALPGWSVVHLLTIDRPTVPAQVPREAPMVVSKSIARSNPTQNIPVRRPESPALATQTADDNLATPNTPKMSWPALVAIAHATGMGCIIIWLALGWITSVRLRRTVHVAPANVSAILNKLASLNRRASKPPQLFTHDRIDVAVALGVWRPMILLPNRWTTSQSHDRLQAILAHEATHVLNYDLQWVALARVLFVALWANPLFWLTKRRLRLDQEALADAAAAEVTSRQQYAEQLVAWARDARSRPALHLSSAVGLWEGPSQLRQRIAILLDEQLTVLRNCSRRWRITAGVLAIGAATALSMVTLQPAIRAEEEKPAAESTRDPLFELYRKHFKQPEPNVIAGMVVDEKFQPLAQARVFLYRFGLRDTGQKLIAEKSTDANGRVRFDNVLDLAKEFPGGKLPPLDDIGEELVQVMVRAPGRVTHSHMQARQMIAKRGDPIIAMMPPAVTLRGRVTGPDGKPVADALVSVGTGGFAPSATGMSARTNANGDYLINDVPPFDLKSRAKQEAAMRSGKDAAMNAYRASPPFLTLKVEHPDFAVAQNQVEKTPGTKDMQLQPAGILVGRVVLGDSGKPAGGARVFAAAHDQWLIAPRGVESRGDDEQRRFVQPYYTTFARADADGKYRFASLPSGYYHLTAELPGWTNVGLRDVPTAPGKTKEAPDLTLTKGGMASIRLVDAKTREPIKVTPETRALIGHHDQPIFDRPPTQRMVTANRSGLFELPLPAGKHELYIGGVYVGEERKWMGGAASPDENSNAVATIVESKSVQVDLPVIDAKSAKATGIFVPGPLPKSEPKAKPSTEKKQSETPNNKSKQMSTPRLRPNVVSGRALDERNQRIANAEVFLFRVNQYDGTRKLLGKKSTDAEGRFRFDSVIDIGKEFPNRKFPPGYEVGNEMLETAVRAPGRIPATWLMMPQFVAQRGEYHEAKLLQAATLRGRVTNASGKPVAGAVVSIGGSSIAANSAARWEGAPTIRTDVDGNYKIDDAPPFDVAEFKKQLAEEEQQRKEAQARGTTTFAFFLSRLILTVEHPDYATKQTYFDKIPGNADVQLEPAAVLEGRVVFADSDKLAVGALVGVVTSIERRDPPVLPPQTDLLKRLVRTDANGRYHIGSLPQGKYDLWAQTPGWVSVGENDVVAVANKTSIAPDLKFTKGGVISARVVDAKTHKPVALPTNARAYLLVRPVSPRPTFPQGAEFITVNAEGYFESHSTPGKQLVGAGGVEINGEMKFSGEPTTEVNVVEGNTVTVDLPVTELPSYLPASRSRL